MVSSRGVASSSAKLNTLLAVADCVSRPVRAVVRAVRGLPPRHGGPGNAPHPHDD